MIIVVSVSMLKYVQMARIQRAVERAWMSGGMCSGREGELDCRLHARDDLAPPPREVIPVEFNANLALRMADYAARIEMDDVPTPEGHTEVKRFDPRAGPTFGVAWMYGSTMILSFRCTITHREIQDDLMAWQVNFDTGERSTHPHDARVDVTHQDPLVHSGFYSVYQRYRNDVLDTIKEHQPRMVLITGHSLGGAVTTLMCLGISEATTKDGRLASVEQIGGYVFGTPRVGNRMLDQRLRECANLSTFWRVVNTADNIQDLPLKVTPNLKHPDQQAFYYEHTGPGHEYYYNWGSWRVNHFLPNYMKYCRDLVSRVEP